MVILVVRLSPLPTALFSKTDMERLTKEISTMLSFEHPNVMPLIGVCLDGEMPLLIMPFMSNGSLLEYVKHNKEELILGSDTYKEVSSILCRYSSNNLYIIIIILIDKDN